VSRKEDFSILHGNKFDAGRRTNKDSRPYSRQKVVRIRCASVWIAVASVLAAGLFFSGTTFAQEVLPAPRAPFKGEIGLSAKDSKPVFHYNLLNLAHYEIAAKEGLAPGKHTVVFGFRYDDGGIGKGGTGTLSVDGKQVAQGRIPNTVPARFSFDETFDIGEDTGTPVSEDYDVPFKFTGQIEKVVVNLGETKLGAADQEDLRKMEERVKSTAQ
jgi:hypothetical protein